MAFTPYVISFSDTDPIALSNTVFDYIVSIQNPVPPSSNGLYGSVSLMTAAPMPNRVRYTVTFFVSTEQAPLIADIGTFGPKVGQPYLVESDNLADLEAAVNERTTTGEWNLDHIGGFDHNGKPQYYAAVIQTDIPGGATFSLGVARSVEQRDAALSALAPTVSNVYVFYPFHAGARWFYPYATAMGGLLHI
jgi:hypothetical protein